MPSSTTEIILAREAERAKALNESIMDTVMSAVVLCSNLSEVEEVMPKALADALGVIAKAWRDEAAERLGRSPLPRGAKTAADKSEYAAGLLAAVAIHLRPHNPFAEAKAQGVMALASRLDEQLDTRLAATASASAAHAAAQGAIAVAAVLDTPVAALGGACGALGVFEWGNTYCTIEPHGGDRLHFSADTLAEWASSEPPTGEPKLELACGVPHTFMPDSPCTLLLAHDGDHYCEGCGTWSSEVLSRIKLDERLSRGCAPETCGGSALDPCYSSMTSNGEIHDGARLAGALPIPEIFPNQCRSQLGAERCMMPQIHTSQHIGTKGGKWSDEDSDLVAPMTIEVDPVPLGGELPPPAGPERILTITPAGQEYVAEPLVKGAQAAGRAISEVVTGAARALSGVFDEMSIGQKLVATGAFSHAAAAAVELEVEQAKAVALTGPPSVGAGDAGNVISAPPSVSAAWTPPLLDVRRMTWAELAEPPADVESKRPAHRSISQLTTYEDCSLKYRLQRYGEAVSVPSWSLVGGAAVHKVIEQGENSSPSWLYRAADMWREIFKATVEEHAASSGIDPELWITANRGKENREWWEVEGEKMIMNYLAWRKGMLAKGWGLVAVELEVRTPATETRRERLGYVDQVWWHHATGAMLLPDLKTGSRDPKGVIQLDTYGRMVAAAGAGKVTPDMIKTVEAGYLMLRTGKIASQGDVFTRTQQAEIDFRFANMDRAERAGIYTPNVGMLCGSCSVRAACPVGRPEL